MRHLTDNDKRIYKNRIKVDHFYVVIKRYPKINCIYEKTLESLPAAGGQGSINAFNK